METQNNKMYLVASSKSNKQQLFVREQFKKLKLNPLRVKFTPLGLLKLFNTIFFCLLTFCLEKGNFKLVWWFCFRYIIRTICYFIWELHLLCKELPAQLTRPHYHILALHSLRSCMLPAALAFEMHYNLLHNKPHCFIKGIFDFRFSILIPQTGRSE